MKSIHVDEWGTFNIQSMAPFSINITCAGCSCALTSGGHGCVTVHVSFASTETFTLLLSSEFVQTGARLKYVRSKVPFEIECNSAPWLRHLLKALASL
jgi:hypothetical protein